MLSLIFMHCPHLSLVHNESCCQCAQSKNFGAKVIWPKPDADFVFMVYFYPKSSENSFNISAKLNFGDSPELDFHRQALYSAV